MIMLFLKMLVVCQVSKCSLRHLFIPPTLPTTKEKSCEYRIYYFLIYKMVFILQSSKMLNEWKVIFP